MYRFSILEEIYRIYYYGRRDDEGFGTRVEALVEALKAEEPKSLPSLNRFLNGQTPKLIYEADMFYGEKDIVIRKNPRFMPIVFHSHDFFKVLYVYHGSLELDFGFQKIMLEGGDICILAPGVSHRVSTLKADDVVFSLLVKQTTFETSFFSLLNEDDIMSSFFRNTIYQETYTSIPVYHTAAVPMVSQCVTEMYFEDRQESTYNNRILNAYFELMIAYLLKHCEQDFILVDNSEARIETNASKVLKYIRDCYDVATLAGAAKKFNYSSAYLSKMIKKMTGKNFVDLVKEQKLRHARAMLKDTEMTLETIAETVGYADASHFSRVFKSEYGVSPNVYRKNGILPLVPK